MPGLMRRWPVAGLLAVSALLRAAPMPSDPALIQGALPNGLRYAILPDARAKGEVEFRLNVAAGSLHETEAQRGLAHAVEHMAFKGTRQFPGVNGMKALEAAGLSVGAHVNAETSYDYTRYKLSLNNATPATLDLAMRVMADWSGGLLFEPSAFDSERPVILEEWRMKRGVAYRLGLAQDALRYAGSRYADREVIGTEAVLRHAPVSEARAFYDHWYRPERMTVVVAGDVDPARIKALIETRFAPLAPRAPALPERGLSAFPPRPPLQVARFTDPENARRQIMIRWARQLDAPASDSASVWRDWLESLAIRLLVKRLQALALEPNAVLRAPRMAPGSTLVSADRVEYQLTFEPVGGDPGPALKTVLAEIERLRAHGAPREDLSAIINEEVLNARAAEQQRRETGVTADRLVESLHYRLPWFSARQWRELNEQWAPRAGSDHVRAVWESLDGLPMQILQIARQDDPALSLTSVRALRADVKAHPPAATQPATVKASVTLPRPAPADVRDIPVSGPEGFARWRLANGMTLQVLSRPGFQGPVQLRATAPGGLADETPDVRHMGGMATLLAERGGYAGIDGKSLTAWSRERQVALRPFVLSMQHGLSGTAPAGRLDDLFALLSVKLRTPAIESATLQSVRQDILSRQDREDADSAFTRFIYRHGLKNSEMGEKPSAAQLAAMSAPGLLAHHRRLFGSRSDWTVTVVGNVSPARVRDLAKTWLAGLAEEVPPRKTPVAEGLRPKPGAGRHVLEAGLEDKGVVNLQYVAPAAWTPADAIAADWLGQLVQERVQQRLRRDEAAIYAVGATPMLVRFPEGAFMLWIRFSADPRRLDELARITEETVLALSRNGPDDAELARIRRQWREARQRALEDAGSWAQALSQSASAGDDPAAFEQGSDLAAGIAPERVKALAAQWLSGPARVFLLKPDPGSHTARAAHGAG
ncbi:M16 family metallopeptidase [Paludibacterium paludis]|uniref:Zinc protease n=1 Tax=Paludibacterium paludis TaxID=1225769 RepID=A0A918U917_9NEIS|nr:insulinase family protein [Paludibacterium paludis]GGY11854.1 zinc protease [Paludibacterium paludis]